MEFEKVALTVPMVALESKEKVAEREIVRFARLIEKDSREDVSLDLLAPTIVCETVVTLFVPV
jgi:hypothetical protein